MTVKKQEPSISTRSIVIILLVVLVVLPATLAVAGAAVFVVTRPQGPEHTVVPQLVGLDVETARIKVAAANLAPPLTFPSWDSTAAPGTVVAQEPQAGEIVTTNAALGLHVSVSDPASALDEMHKTKRSPSR